MLIHDLRERVARKPHRVQWRWLARHTARYRKWNILSIVLGLCGTGLSLLGSLLGRSLVDAAVARRMDLLLIPACCYAAAQLLRAALGAVSRYLSGVIRVRAENELRTEIFAHFLNAQWLSAQKYHPGELIDRIHGDVAAAAAGVLGWLPSLITCLAQLIAALALCLYFDPSVAAAALLCGLALLLGRGCMRRLRQLNEQKRTAQGELTAFYEETFRNYTAVKALDRFRQRMHRLAQLQARLLELTRARERLSALIGLLSGVVTLSVCGACLAWALLRMWREQLGYGTLVLMLRLAFMVAGAFRELIALVPFAASVTVAVERLTELTALPVDDSAPSESAARLAAQTGGIKITLSQVDFSYVPSAPVLCGASLHASPGEIVAIVGASGSGKTTLLRLLLGLVCPTRGQIVFRRGECEANAEPSVRQLCSYVAQENTLFSGTVADALRLYRENATEGELSRALHEACADDFVSALPNAMDTPVGPGGVGLSEGQRQRLAIAGALLSGKPIVLFDEATSALDMQTEALVLQRLRACLGTRTAVFTTHRPGVLKYCDRVYCLRHGQLTQLSEQQIVHFAQWALIE